MLLLVLLGTRTHAQGGVGDLLGGKLVNPKVGQWAMYKLIDAKENKKYFIRQAIVDKEKVGRKTGYWVELEVIPELGYRTILKMLLVGPASEAGSIKRIIQKDGNSMAVSLPVFDQPKEATKGGTRKSLGKEDVITPKGVLKSERIMITSEDGSVVDLWLNDKVRPTGVVRARASGGELILQDYGSGGKSGRTAIVENPVPYNSQAIRQGKKTQVRINTNVTKKDEGEEK